MNLNKEISDSWSELVFQDLLIDTAAVIAGTETDRAENRNEPEWAQTGVARESPPGWPAY
jgi:hypothetical protein